MIFIFSGDYIEALYYATKKGLDNNKWRYLQNREQLLNCNNAEIIKYGKYYERDDIIEIGIAIKDYEQNNMKFKNK